MIEVDAVEGGDPVLAIISRLSGMGEAISGAALAGGDACDVSDISIGLVAAVGVSIIWFHSASKVMYPSSSSTSSDRSAHDAFGTDLAGVVSSSFWRLGSGAPP